MFEAIKKVFRKKDTLDLKKAIDLSRVFSGSDINPGDLILLEEFYGKIVWVFAAIKAIATSASEGRVKVLKGNADNAEQEESVHEITKVFSRPNAERGYCEFFQEGITHLQLSGNWYFEVVRMPGTGEPIQFWNLMPTNVTVVPTVDRKSILGYLFRTEQGQFVRFEKDEICHIKLPNPLNNWYGISPLSSSLLSVQTDRAAQEWNKNFFRNGGVPDGVLSTEQMLDDEAYNRMLAAWRKAHKGIDRSHNIAILEEGTKYQSTGISPRDMSFEMMRKFSREEILAAFGVPPGIVGILEFANYANLKAQRQQFWEDTIIPILSLVKSAMNHFFAEDLGEEFELVWDVSHVPAFRGDEKDRAEIATSLTRDGILTINEARKKFYNLPPVSWGSTYFAPLNKVPVEVIMQGMSNANPALQGKINVRPDVEFLDSDDVDEQILIEGTFNSSTNGRA